MRLSGILCSARRIKGNKRMETGRIWLSTTSPFLIPSGAKAAKSRISMVRFKPCGMEISASGLINLAPCLSKNP